MLLSQYRTAGGRLQVVAREGSEAYEVKSEQSLYEMAMEAAAQGTPLRELVLAAGLNGAVDLDRIAGEGRLAPPLTHPDPAHLHLTGTGLTHLGSASTRASMHAKKPEDETDSMKMFRMGVEGGKPANGHAGVQPEWFYKGDGACVVAPEAEIPVPHFAEDAGEEPELAGLYVIGDDGQPWRVGYAIGNEFSDHVTERYNYLWLAHSKLRACSFGPELLVGELPVHLEGISRIVRGNKTVWEKTFLTGEANMAHSLANLEHHHFKYVGFRRPGDVHVHFFGTATLSFADDIRTREGDRFEISLAYFGRPLRNPLSFETASAPIDVKSL